METKLKEMIVPRWIEEQQGVYIPLINKVLLKDNVPEMSYNDYMDYAKECSVQIATKEELLQMYLQKEEINIILKEHNGDLLDGWFGSSSEHNSYSEWFVNFGSGYCFFTGKSNSYLSRAVVALKEQTKTKENMKQFSLEEYLKNPNRKIVTRNGLNVRILCTDRNSIYPIVALIGNNCDINTYLENGKNSSNLINLDLFFAPEKHEGWVNVYRTPNGLPCTTTNVYATKEEAEEYGCSMVATCKIEWEE